MKNLLQNLLLFSLGTATALGLGEFAVRQIAPQRPNTIVSPVPMFETDLANLPPGVSVANLPNVPLHQQVSTYDDIRFTVQTNNWGMLQQQDFAGPASNLVLVAGDSFAAGAGVDIDKNYFALVAHGLPERRLLNLAVNSHSNYDQYYLLRDRHERLRADGSRIQAVVLHIFLGNDIWENATYRAAERFNVRLRAPQAQPPAWYEAFHLWRLGRSLADRAVRGELFPDPARPQGFQFHNVVLSDFLRKLDIGASFEVLTRFADYCTLYRCRFVVVVLPTREIASKRLRAKYEASFGQRARFDLVRQQLDAWLSERQIPWLDLTDTFLALDDGADYFYGADIHWNAEGQRLGAETTAAWLKQVLAETGD